VCVGVCDRPGRPPRERECASPLPRSLVLSSGCAVTAVAAVAATTAPPPPLLRAATALLPVRARTRQTNSRVAVAGWSFERNWSLRAPPMPGSANAVTVASGRGASPYPMSRFTGLPLWCGVVWRVVAHVWWLRGEKKHSGSG